MFYNLPFARRLDSLSYVSAWCNWSSRSGVDGVLSPPSSPQSQFSASLLHLSHPPSLSAFPLSLSTAYWAAVWNKVWETEQRLPVPTAQRPPPTCQRRHPTPSQTRPSRPCLQPRPSPPTLTTPGRITLRSPSSSRAPPSQPPGRWVRRLGCGATVSRELLVNPCTHSSFPTLVMCRHQFNSLLQPLVCSFFTVCFWRLSFWRHSRFVPKHRSWN